VTDPWPHEVYAPPREFRMPPPGDMRMLPAEVERLANRDYPLRRTFKDGCQLGFIVGAIAGVAAVGAAILVNHALFG
jgi:hypothetical protein